MASGGLVGDRIAGRADAVPQADEQRVRVAKSGRRRIGRADDFAALVRREPGTSASTLLNATRADASMRIDVGEPGLRLLMAAGFSSVAAAFAVWLVFRVAITASSGTDPSFSQFLEPTAELVDAAADADAFVALRQVHDDLTASEGRDTFAFDLEITLDGIAARLERAATGD